MPVHSLMQVVWRHRHLLAVLVRRDIANRYNGSVLGLFWALLHPMALLGLYALVFEAIFRVRIPGLATGQPYVLFIAVVLWPWLMFQEAVMRGTGAVLQHAALVRKVAFPHELVVYSAVLAAALVQVSGYALVLGVLTLLGYGLHAEGLLLALLALPALLLLATALALALAALQVFVRDVEHVLTQAMSVLFYATPLLYPLTLVPDWLQLPMALNPLTHITEPLRRGLLEGAWPAPLPLLLGLLGLAALLWLARRLFLRLSPYFEDML